MLTTFLASCALVQATLPPLKVQGANLVDPSGHTVLLKGCNVGDWLMVEFWMLGLSERKGLPTDQYSLEQLLTRRFGKSEDERLMNLYRSSWMTDRDWENIETFHFNLVRVPFNYRLLEDDSNPKHLRPDAFRWLDTAVDQAERHGLYVILDMHGVQGGQNQYDHSGRAGQNKLWTTPEDQDRMAWLWTQIAARYRDRSAVVAYDPMNEPYGGSKQQVLSVFEKVYPAIRSADPEKLILAHGATDNFDHFGDPKEHGWHNVGFQMHFYPGLFGDAPGLKASVRHLNRLKRFAERVKQLDVPFLVGEMNVVLNQSGGAPMMRRFFDTDASYGWMTTMWSYKVLTASGGIDGGPNGGSWAMFTNAEPAKNIDFQDASEPQIEAYLRSLATEKLVPYEALRRYMTEAKPDLPPLPTTGLPRVTAPKDEVLDGWTSTDVGGSLAGGLVRGSGDSFELYGGGDDVWNSTDQFRFLHRKVSGDFDLSVSIDSVEDVAEYTKAGLMVRASTAPDAAAALLSVFPAGGCQVAVREAAGSNMVGLVDGKGSFPGLEIRIVRRGSKFTFSVNGKVLAERDLPALAGEVEVGPMALSHSNDELAKVVYRNLTMRSVLMGPASAMP